MFRNNFMFFLKNAKRFVFGLKTFNLMINPKKINIILLMINI